MPIWRIGLSYVYDILYKNFQLELDVARCLHWSKLNQSKQQTFPDFFICDVFLWFLLSVWFQHKRTKIF